MMSKTEKLLIAYAATVCEMFGEKALAEMAVNYDEDAGTTIKKLMLFNIRLAQLFGEEIDAIHDQIYD